MHVFKMHHPPFDKMYRSARNLEDCTVYDGEYGTAL